MTALQSKNAKQRTECLDELGHILQNHGPSVLQPSAGACLKEIAKQIADRDNSVRSAALNCITEVYFQEGDRLYKMIGNLPEKDMAMLEERIKRQSKTRAPPTTGVQEAPTAAQQQHTTVRSGGGGGGGGNASQQSQVTARPGSNLASRLARPQTGSGSGGGPRSGSASSNSDQQIGGEPQMRYGGGGPPPTQLTRGSPSKARPVSGAFTLDLEKIESQVDRQLGEQGIRLVNHNLDEIFNDEPVMLPQTVTGGKIDVEKIMC